MHLTGNLANDIVLCLAGVLVGLAWMLYIGKGDWYRVLPNMRKTGGLFGLGGKS
jgi:hypothetical protein